MVFELDGENDFDQELAEYELLGYDIDGMIERELDQYQLMGYDREDPELMGGIIKRIIARIRARRAAKAAAAAQQAPIMATPPQNYAVTTPYGTAGYNQQTGLTYQDPNQPGIAVPQQMSIADKIKANPMLLAIPAVAVMFVMMKNK